jgi:hydroxyacylglutathione hydrolase
MHLQPLPALADNYIWTLASGEADAIVVDPGDASPVLAAADSGLRPAAVLLTHHHSDHIGGAAALLRRWPGLPVFAPHDVRIDLPCHRVSEGDSVDVAGWTFSVMEVPGHTLSHIAYFGHAVVFSGDTLFSLGCGRLFEGSPRWTGWRRFRRKPACVVGTSTPWPMPPSPARSNREIPYWPTVRSPPRRRDMPVDPRFPA